MRNGDGVEEQRVAVRVGLRLRLPREPGQAYTWHSIVAACLYRSVNTLIME